MKPDPKLTLGKLLLSLATGLAGVQSLYYGSLPPEFFPVHWPWPVESVLAVLVIAAAILVVGAAGPRAAAVSSMVLSLAILGSVVLQLPNLLRNIRSGGVWTTVCEMLAIGSSWWLLTTGPDRWKRVSRIGFGLTMPVFGVLHFVYIDYIVSVIPNWLPGHLFWAYFTGVAHILAGLAIVTGVVGPLASRLLALMFGLWVVMLHLPRVLASGFARAECTSLLVAMAMCGGSLLIACQFQKAPADKSAMYPQDSRVATV